MAIRAGAIALALAFLAPAETENAVANGDTRTISLYHAHTHESIVATFRVNGGYDQATLDKLNWFLRDWRRDEPTHMDPRLFDAIWETYRESGSQMPIVIVSAYRSPETNAMLRRRSRAVAEFSQHMLGKAMDMHYQDVPMSRVREIAMHLQRGGVGYYPTAGTPFVHMDVGGVRAWPRMSREQLVHLFPDEKTVHIPADGRPLARYEEARVEIEARNGVSIPTVAQVQQKGFLEMLFGGGGDDEVAAAAGPRNAPRVGGDSRVAAFIKNTGMSNASTRIAGLTGFGRRSAAAPAPAATASLDNDNPSSFFVAEAARQSPAAVAPPVAPRAAAPVAVAALAPAQAKPVVLSEPAPAVLRAGPDIADSLAPVAPAPPRRPVELAYNTAAPDYPAASVVPLPPARPADLTKIADGIRTGHNAGLPDMIVNGGVAPVAATVAALAYAPPLARVATDASRPVARANEPRLSSSVSPRTVSLARSASAIGGRLDRGNFRALTEPVDAAHLTLASIAPVLTGLRSASRAEAMDLVFAPPVGDAAGFEPGLAPPVPAGALTNLRLRGDHAELPGATPRNLN